MEDIRGPAAGLAAGAPMLLPVADIDEDPGQPRTDFDDEALRGLAATIAEGGVRQPVSVRPHPEVAGRWILNFGARRLRASKLVGRTTIPAFQDVAATTYDQVIENEQREGLKPLELALFVQRELAVGRSQADIARKLGKSRSFLTLVTAMIDPPDWLMAIYRSGRCRGLSELYELRRLHETDAASAESLLAGGGPIGRADLKRARSGSRLEGQTSSDADGATVGVAVSTLPGRTAMRSEPARVPAPGGAVSPSGSARRPRLTARLDGEVVDVVLDLAPDTEGFVFVEPACGSGRIAVGVERLQALSLTIVSPGSS